MKITQTLLAFAIVFSLAGCSSISGSADDKLERQNEQVQQEAVAQTGMPAIKNFRERKMLKEILELRDQDGLNTYTYVWNEMQGKLVFLGNTIGYGIPYATQYTSPQKSQWLSSAGGVTLPQCDPNGLFSPDNAEGTWILLKAPNGTKVSPVYVEPRIIVSPFKLEVK